MAIKKIKAVELVLDWSLWPRYEAQSLDSTNLRRMKEALRAGVTLPPITANEADRRVTDGFHRIRTYLDLYGDDVEIKANFKKYESEAAMFLDAAALNASQGLPLSPRDVVHSILVARRMHIPVPAIGLALSLDETMIAKLLKRRTATTQSGERIPLTGGALALAGKELTPVQEHHVRHSNGTIPAMHARMLINALNADAVVFTDKAVATLRVLYETLGILLEEIDGKLD